MFESTELVSKVLAFQGDVTYYKKDKNGYYLRNTFGVAFTLMVNRSVHFYVIYYTGFFYKNTAHQMLGGYLFVPQFFPLLLDGALV